ncbi:unnamed protein product [Clonostachys rosea]|uniref:Poly A polymerase head domain-containing protein n=1 Tax=Bionectria ochroleuca TaxID=29856 RepID=A0ABY6TNK4_BIOOC|nr:unnamed protein product [Clonostachys rosea]
MWRRLYLGNLGMKRKLGDFLIDSPTFYTRCASTSPSRQAHRAKAARMATEIKLELSDKEQQLRGLLLDVARSIDESAAGQGSAEPVTLRWAGGWVRDRLLGIESHDIDVAINTMTGIHFAQHMRDYCETPEAKAKHSINDKDVGNLHHVASNPEKSKHLETAMVRMFGLDLDFVNLRKETYTDQSRNPQMEFGTAEEDALRRDATINALFYNLNKDVVEDFTGGVPDMAAKLIKTPLEPLQTFTDDPLRILRLVRFASRLQFSIDPGTEKFMGDSKVLDALRVKISRERVGIELEKMLQGKHPAQALRFINRLGLYRAIFSDPDQEPPELTLLPRWAVAYECLDSLIKQQTPQSIADLLIRTDEASYTAWNLAAVAPWMLIQDDPNVPRKASHPPPVGVVARNGFKAPNRLADVISAAHRHREEILKLKLAVQASEAWVKERDTVGMMIRRWDHFGSWKLQVLNALLVDAMEQLEEWKEKSTKEQDDFLREWQNLLDHLVELDVVDAPNIKRLVDGRALSKGLGIKPGVWTGKALDVCMAWQLRNPNETDISGAVEEVRKKKGELGIPI